MSGDGATGPGSSSRARLAAGLPLSGAPEEQDRGSGTSAAALHTHASLELCPWLPAQQVPGRQLTTGQHSSRQDHAREMPAASTLPSIQAGTGRHTPGFARGSDTNMYVPAECIDLVQARHLTRTVQLCFADRSTPTDYVMQTASPCVLELVQRTSSQAAA